MLICDTSDDNVKILKSIAWAYRSCIATFKYLRSVITIDVGFLLGYYKSRLLMMCGYNTENKFLSLAFEIMDEKNLNNWG
jgi:hypothetical protein